MVTRLAAEEVGADGHAVGLDLNPGMIGVAGSTTPPELGIEWQTGSAESMPSPDDAFDVVLCQLGLQFMADKPAALEEMRRVLTADGRLILSLSGPTPPPFGAMAEALSKHITPQAGAFVNMVFSLHDPDEIQALVSDAGFRDVEIQTDEPTLRLPAPEEFLWQYVSSTPLAEPVAQAGDDQRAAVERDVASAWQRHTENGESLVSVPMKTVVARK
ncbi:MAG: class I SAM-dependent methyltransferase [Thermomicrobiales bacterium]